MTTVRLIGSDNVALRTELLAAETARDALSSYNLTEPFVNTIQVETISLGAAVSFLNDLNWYLTRFTRDAVILEPSINTAEWLSRDLALEIRTEAIDPSETGEFLKIYGVTSREENQTEETDTATESKDDESNTDTSATENHPHESTGPPSDSRSPEESASHDVLTEPLFVRRIDGEIPSYDLADVQSTFVIRVTPHEFGG